jgi:hypothetical protein
MCLRFLNDRGVMSIAAGPRSVSETRRRGHGAWGYPPLRASAYYVKHAASWIGGSVVHFAHTAAISTIIQVCFSGRRVCTAEMHGGFY